MKTHYTLIVKDGIDRTVFPNLTTEELLGAAKDFTDNRACVCDANGSVHVKGGLRLSVKEGDIGFCRTKFGLDLAVKRGGRVKFAAKEIAAVADHLYANVTEKDLAQLTAVIAKAKGGVM